MRWALIVVGVIAVLVVLTFVVGRFRPRAHSARTQGRFASPPDSVWAVISDYQHWAEWQPGTKRVERLPDRGGRTTLITEGTWGEMPMQIEAFEPPRRLITFLDGGVFRGRWIWLLEPTAEGGTSLTITEEAEIDNPFFRALMIFNDNYKTMLGMQRALGRRLGETVEPASVE
jgi:uncharacterized protein YndB with AHSA1/START domain